MMDRRSLARRVLEAAGVRVRTDGDLESLASRLRGRGRLHRRLTVLLAAVLLAAGPASIVGELPGPAWLGMAGAVAGVLLAVAAPHLLPDPTFTGEVAASLLEREGAAAETDGIAPARSPGGRLLQAQRKALQLDEAAMERLASGEAGAVAAEVHRKWRRFELFRAVVVTGLGGLLLFDVWTGTAPGWAVVTAVAVVLALWIGLERARERAVAVLAPRLDAE